MTPSATPSPLSLPVLAAGAAAFLTLGLIQAMYGPAFPFFEQKFQVTAATVGVIASAHFLGSALAPLLTGFLLTRLSVRRVVVGSLIVLAAGMALVAAAPAWGMAVLGAFVGGVGLGGVSAALNAAYASLGTQPVNLVNAMFGVGSMLSPLLVAGLAPHALGGPFLAVALCCGLTLIAARTWGFPEVARPAVTESGPRAGGLVLLFALILGCYVSLEVGLGAWFSKYLEHLHVASLAVLVSAYWGGLTAGRVLTGLFGGRFAAGQLVVCASVTITLCLALTLLGLPGLTALLFVVSGLVLGPVFGTTLAWMSQLISARLVPFVLIAGSAGGVLAPALLGWCYARAGAPAIALVLTLLAAALCSVVFLTAHATRTLRHSLS